jgi:hypothetical protein
LKTILRISRYEVSKDSSPTYFPIMRMIKPLCKDRLKYFTSFLLPCGCIGFALYNKFVGGYCLDKSRSGSACVTWWQGTQISRVPLDISETLCPSRVRKTRQVLFHVFRPERRTPAGKMYHCWKLWEVA